MKKLFIIFVAISLFACKKEVKEEVKDYAVITGKITSSDGNVFTIGSMDRSYIDTLSISADGTFRDTLRIHTGHYMIADGENYHTLYIEKGKDLTLNYDVNDFIKTATFSGDGAEVNSYLIAKRRKEEAIKGGDFKELYKLEEDAFKAKILEVKEAIGMLISDAKAIPEGYQAEEKKNIEYAYLNSLGNYEGMHGRFTENPDFKTSEGFSKELETLDYGNEADFEFSEAYRDIVSGHYYQKMNELMVSDSLSYEMAFLKVAEPIAEPSIKNTLLYSNAEMGITFAEDIDVFYKRFMSNSTNETHKANITKSYNKLKTVAKGRPSPKFVGYENYKGGTTSLDDLKGKYVYIDLWATWCGPCKREIPFLQEVEKKYHGKNIDFVSISVDTAKDHDKWKKMVEDMKLTGVQLIADNDFNSSFIKDYLVEGIPRFLLIDPDGNIVSSSAPRPSDPKLVELFDELNI